jgi:hypothetical protein
MDFIKKGMILFEAVMRRYIEAMKVLKFKLRTIINIK